MPADRERELMQRALSLVEAEVGSPVRVGTVQTAARKQTPAPAGRMTGAETTAEVGRVNSDGEPIVTVTMAVRDVYTRGQLKEGTMVVRMRLSGNILPEWDIESVDIDVDLGGSDGVQRARVFPKQGVGKMGATGGGGGAGRNIDGVGSGRVRLFRPER